MEEKKLVDTVLDTLNLDNKIVKTVKNIFSETETQLTDSFKRSLIKGLDLTALPYYDSDPYRYRLQAFTITKDFLYITAHGEKEDPSMILVYKEDGKYLGKILLPTEVGKNAHVGGISYDKENDVLFITGKRGEVLALNNKKLTLAIKDSMLLQGTFQLDLESENYIKSDFILSGKVNINDIYASEIAKYYLGYYEKKGEVCPYTREQIIEKFSKIKLKAASVHYDAYTKKIYVSTFSADTNIFVYDVKIETGKVHYSLYTIYGLGVRNTGPINNSTNMPYGVQGVCTYHDRLSNSYLILCSSFGKTSSTLTKYKINENGKLSFVGQTILSKQYALQNMMVDGKGNLLINYENCSFGTNGSKFYEISVTEIKGKLDDPAYIKIMDTIKYKIHKYDEASGYHFNEKGDIVV